MAAWFATLLAILQMLAALLGSMAQAAPQPAGTPAHDVQPSPAATKAATAVSPDVRVVATRDGAAVDATVAGGELARVWRLEIAGTGSLSERRIVVTVETSDIAFGGGVGVYEGATRVAAFDLDRDFDYCDRKLALCLSQQALALPGAAASLSVHAAASGTVRYVVSGWIREAREEAFVFGPWIAGRPVEI